MAWAAEPSSVDRENNGWKAKTSAWPSKFVTSRTRLPNNSLSANSIIPSPYVTLRLDYMCTDNVTVKGKRLFPGREPTSLGLLHSQQNRPVGKSRDGVENESSRRQQTLRNTRKNSKGPEDQPRHRYSASGVQRKRRGRFNASKGLLYNAIKLYAKDPKRGLRARKLMGRTVILHSDLMDWLNRLPVKTAPSATHAERGHQRWAAAQRSENSAA